MKKERKLRIAQIAPLWFPIPPKKYGGTERIIHYLTEGLVKRGHKVTLFASGDSKTKARLFSVTKKSLIESGVPWTDRWWNSFNYSVAFERANQFDIIHSHWNWMGTNFQRLTKTPVIHTFHNIIGPRDTRWKIWKYYKNDTNVVFISKKEKRNSLVKFKHNWIIYNSTDTSHFKFNPKPKDHFIWIGRVDRVKGIENAIKIAEKSGIKLLLAGQVQRSARHYFEEKIKPHLSKKIRYLGEISQKELPKFYSQAKALIYPIEWEEPFGLVMIEAMACGTPVIVFNKGSAPEVVKNGKTGFLVENINQAVKSLKRVDKIKREDCRDWVEKKFSIQRMVSDYEKLYYQILNQRK